MVQRMEFQTESGKLGSISSSTMDLLCEFWMKIGFLHQFPHVQNGDSGVYQPQQSPLSTDERCYMALIQSSVPVEQSN